MKNIILVILFSSAVQASASWSEFAHVTPATEHRYELNVEVVPSPSNKEMYDIRFRSDFFSPDRPFGKCAWLIIASRKLTPEEQIRRHEVWEPDRTNQDLLIVAKLLPKYAQLFDKEKKQHTTIQQHFELTLHKSVIEHAYIYIDFPSHVFDGGYYYSIDLPAYVEKKIPANEEFPLTSLNDSDEDNIRGGATEL